MSISHLLDPATREQIWKALQVYSINTNSISTSNINIENLSNSNVSTPNAGVQTIFGNSDTNNNLTAKNASSNLISLSSALSNFIVSSDQNEGMKYTSIQTAINDAVLTGNTENIIIRSGTYNENINLPDKINLLGVGNININNPSVIINGLMTINLNGESTISNISFTNDSNNCVNITGNNRINFNYCNFSTTTSGDCININDLNAFVKFNYCNFINCPVTNYYINANASNNCILFNSTVGALAPTPPTGNLNVNSGLLVMIYSIINATVFINDPSFCISLYSFMPIGNQYAYVMSGLGSTLISVNTTIISDPTSSTDFISGTGTLVKSLISLLGRTTASGGITVSSFFIF